MTESKYHRTHFGFAGIEVKKKILWKVIKLFSWDINKTISPHYSWWRKTEHLVKLP